MDKFDKEVTDFFLYNEVMKNSNNNKPSYSGSKLSGYSSPAIAVICIVLAIIGWIWFIGKSCVSCTSKSTSGSIYSYKPRRSYSHSYSSRSHSSNNTYSLRSSSSYSSHSYSIYSRKGTPLKKSSDPYNARDYYDAYDFYYDNYDDFWDYEDAEDYYDEHCDD